MKSTTLPALLFLTRLRLKPRRAFASPNAPVSPTERRQIFEALAAAGACDSAGGAQAMLSALSDEM